MLLLIINRVLISVSTRLYISSHGEKEVSEQ